MKKIIFSVLVISLAFWSCSEDNDLERKTVDVSLNFTQNWNDTIVTRSDFNDIKFTNKNGEKLSITKLRYLISDVTFYNQNGDTIATKDYNLIDLEKDESLTFKLSEKIPTGTYSKVIFTFGFNKEDNIDGAYQDLNTTSFNVPEMMGGGYHFMQFEGKFIDSTNSVSNFNYHTISAINNSDPTNVIKTDTSFDVTLSNVTISSNATIEVKSDLSQWFKNPNIWDLNVLNIDLMGNYDAQIKMSANGKSVFSLGEIIQ